jgi:hypothetical protein
VLPTRLQISSYASITRRRHLPPARSAGIASCMRCCGCGGWPWCPSRTRVSGIDWPRCARWSRRAAWRARRQSRTSCPAGRAAGELQRPVRWLGSGPAARHAPGGVRCSGRAGECLSRRVRGCGDHAALACGCSSGCSSPRYAGGRSRSCTQVRTIADCGGRRRSGLIIRRSWVRAPPAPLIVIEAVPAPGVRPGHRARHQLQQLIGARARGDHQDAGLDRPALACTGQPPPDRVIARICASSRISTPRAGTTDRSRAVTAAMRAAMV